MTHQHLIRVVYVIAALAIIVNGVLGVLLEYQHISPVSLVNAAGVGALFLLRAFEIN